MTAAPSVYGPLDDDIALLASDGKVIRRHDGMYRLNGAPEKLTAAMVRGMAAEVRNRRLDARSAPATKNGHEITERGKGRPPGGRAGTPVEGRAGSSPAAPTCTKCGGLMSKWSKGQCAVCYAQAGCGSYPQRPTAERPDKFWRAVGPSDEPTKSCGGRGVRTTEDNPAPHGHVPSVGAGHDQQTRAVADRRDRRAPDVGNVIEPETDPGRPPPHPSPPQDLITPTTLQWRMPNAGDGGETAATRCRPSPLNSDAAPSGRVDVVVSDVPPVTIPQTASGPGRSAVTPAPESGAVVGTISDALTANPLGAYCGCGALRSHTGRCWHRRGLTGPEPAEQTPHKRSRTRKHRKAAGIPARILALENANDALELKVAALEALMSMEGLQ